MEWIIVLFVVLVLAGMVVMLRKRREEQRAAEHERAQAFMMSLQGANLMSVPADVTTASSTTSLPAAPFSEDMPDTGSAAAVAKPWTVPAVRRGYLDHRHQVVWHWLRTGLPEAEIFARGSLRRVVGSERVRKDMMLDFVICNAQLEVLAAVDLEKSGQVDPGASFKRMLLEEVGVRYANWNAAQLPDQRVLRRWIEDGADVTAPDQMTR
jgi:hypothetical protein